jgi:hypothetical protein
LRRLGATAVIVAVLCGAGAAQARVVRHPPKHRLGLTTSTNWSGYAIAASGATQVIGTWQQQPAICALGETSWSSPWVGIDGDVSNTVEQTGTDTDCSGGTPSYYAWYEMYPKPTQVLPMTVTPGHFYTASVRYTTGVFTGFTLSLTDDSVAGLPAATEHIPANNARRSSVEWIVEGPSNGLLTEFGTLPFSSMSGAFNGQAAKLASAQSITMVNNGGSTRAKPGPLSGGASTDTWLHG